MSTPGSSWLFAFAGQRWVTWLTVALGPVFSALCLAGFVGLHRQGEPWASILLPVAVVPVSVAVATYVRWLAGPRRFVAANELVGDDLATVVPVMRRSLLNVALPASALLLIAVWGLLLAVRNDGSRWPWVVAVVVVGSVLPQVCRSLLRRPVLALTAGGVVYRGQTIDSRLAWDDIAGVGLRAGPRGQLLTIVGHAGAASWTSQRAYWIFAFEWRPTDEYIDVELHGSGDHELEAVLPAWIERYWRTPALRSELGTAEAVRSAETVREQEVRSRG